jgi:hypothetical protein
MARAPSQCLRYVRAVRVTAHGLATCPRRVAASWLRASLVSLHPVHSLYAWRNACVCLSQTVGTPHPSCRYDFGGKPLWQSPAPPPPGMVVAPCPCGQPRVFEWQLLPSVLLAVAARPGAPPLPADPVAWEWETLLVFCCPDSCAASDTEVVWVR